MRGTKQGRRASNSSAGEQSVQGLAHEDAHALRQKSSGQRVMQDIAAQFDSRTHPPTHPLQYVRSGPGHEVSSTPSTSASAGGQCCDEAVRAEAATVQAKYMSHVDTATEVVIRFDFMSEQDTRVVVLIIEAATFAGFVILLVQFAHIITADGSTRRLGSRTINKWNVAAGSICLALITSMLVTYSWRLRQACQQHKVWQAKRWRHTLLFLVELAVQWLNLVFYIVPNVYLLLHRCEFLVEIFKWCGWLSWTCWNTLFLLFLLHAYGGRLKQVRPKVILYMEGPWHWMWPCLIPWALLQVASSLAWLLPLDQRVFLAMQPVCRFGLAAPSCIIGLRNEICIYLEVGVSIGYFVATCYLYAWKLRQHKRFPLRVVQVGMLFFRLQLQLRRIVMVFFALCLILLWLVRIHSCTSFQFTWLGLMPMQVVMTANTFVWAYIGMPHSPADDAAAKRTWEQEFAWAEGDKPVKLAAKALTVPHNSKLSHTPIFCFETMLHMLYWTCLVYDYKRAPAQYQRKPSCRAAEQPSAALPPQQPPQQHTAERTTPPQQHTAERTILSLPTALALYGLTHSELLWELQLDTRCLMGWSDSKIVLAFRGTASITNAWSDLQAWRVAHPPVRGHRLMGTRPLVHLGFLKSWQAGDFNQKVLKRTMDIVQSRKPGSGKLKIYVTGHSMGGALATLAAYDIRQELAKLGQQQQQGVEVVCYTFGAPRTGNHAFARDYNHMVPDTWSIINGQDIVTQGGKFLILYKRPGHRVIVNSSGVMMVSPSAIETSVQQHSGGGGVDEHYMTSYHHAILAVVLAQFTSKAFADGTEGIAKLIEASPYLKELFQTQMGICLEDIRKLGFVSHEDRLLQAGSSLEGAHLPPRGFYFIKSIRASQLQAHNRNGPTHTWLSNWLPFWRHTSQEPALIHPSGDPARGSLDEKPTVSGSQSGELELEMP